MADGTGGLVRRWANATSNLSDDERASLGGAVEKHGRAAPTLYRGVREIGDQLKRSQDEHEALDLTSWTSSKETAHRFSGKWGHIKSIPAGVAKGIRVADHVDMPNDWEHEWIVQPGLFHDRREDG
jgi:hypothetical protein